MTIQDTVCATNQFSARVNSITSNKNYTGHPDAFAIGLATVYTDSAGERQLLDVRFPHTNVGENNGSAALFWQAAQNTKASESSLVPGEISMPQLEQLRRAFDAFRHDGKEHPNIVALDEVIGAYDYDDLSLDDGNYNYTYAVVLGWVQDFDQPPQDNADIWLRLTLLSETKMPPNSMNLEGIFGMLPILAWTPSGPVLPTSAWEVHRLTRSNANSIDKFPPMLNYVIPRGVRVADGSRVRLGAHLAPGTTVMHEGFVNYNAGTLGRSMVEGRISQGVVVGDGTDIGGGASTMGTLSGGGKEVISVGERCLIGANGGIGISLGDDCVVEAGLYVTASLKVMLVNGDTHEIVKAKELSGKPNLLFRRNSEAGWVEAIVRETGTSPAVALNPALHVA